MGQPVTAANLEFNEGDHPRGTGDQGGQFVEKGTSTSTARGTLSYSGTPQTNRYTTSKKAKKLKARTSTLRRDADNDPAAVAQLQALIRELKLVDIAVDGTYGTATEAAVRAIQEKLGLNPTGAANLSLVKRLKEAHQLSPCVDRGASQVTAAAGEDAEEEYDSEVVSKVEVAPDVWVCAHDNGSVSLKLPAAAARDWVEAVSDMADAADEHAAEPETAEPEPVEAAAGHDVTPGHDELHHYWTRGEGLAKWVDSPTPWTTLVALLTKHVGPLKAKTFASRWFIEVFGFAAGSDKNRVMHGKPPRGHLVGPG